MADNNRAHTTLSEIAFIKRRINDKVWLEKYIRAEPKRKDWGKANRAVVMEFAWNALGRLE